MSALSFPLSLATFWDTLPISEVTIDCPERDAIGVNFTAGGEVLTVEMGPRLWKGSVILGPLLRSEAIPLRALMDLLRPPGRTFLATDSTHRFPLLDPNGTTLGASEVTILSLNSDHRQLALTGLPAAYVLGRGDYLGITYGTGQRQLHQVVASSVTANGSGVTSQFEVTPQIPIDVDTGDAVDLGSPSIKCRLMPRTLNLGVTRRGITEGMQFQFTQTLR